MDERVAKLQTVESCRRFAANAKRLGYNDLAVEARKKAIEIKAADYGATSAVERECLQAVYAYEDVLTRKNKRTTRATGTWQMIERHGILPSVERAVNRETEAAGYKALAEMGLRDFAFEAVILRHPSHFSAEAREKAQQRLKDWAGAL